MKRVIFWAIIGMTIVITLVYCGITAIMQCTKKKKREKRVNSIVREAQYALIK